MCPASDCKKWFSGGVRKGETNHCCSQRDKAAPKRGRGAPVQQQQQQIALRRHPRSAVSTGVNGKFTSTPRRNTAMETATTTTTTTTTPPASPPAAIAAAPAPPARKRAAEGSPLPPEGFHMREVCPLYSFMNQTTDADGATASQIIGNGCCCSYCWCYVCDNRARLCKEWYKPGSFNADEHCHSHHNSPHWQQKRHLGKLTTKGKKGPFAPNHTDAQLDKTLALCRHCQWYFRFPEKNIPTSEERPLPCWDDLCLRCGRVALEKDLQKNQQTTAAFTASSLGRDYFLYGQKEIPFTVVAHDPRRLKQYEQAWISGPIIGQFENNPEDNEIRWAYDEGDRQNEVFLHRLGGSPKFESLERIMAVGPVLGGNSLHQIRPDDTDDDAILLTDNHYLLFHFLTANRGKVDIKATWNKSNQSGVSVFDRK